jgi:uncharacterized membrane protein YoaK (UPF0700 family)
VDPVWRALLLVIVAGFVDAIGFLALAARMGLTALAVWAGFLVGSLAGGALFALVGLAGLLVPLALLLVLVRDTLRRPVLEVGSPSSL